MNSIIFQKIAYTEIILHDKSKCIIYELKPWILWAANVAITKEPIPGVEFIAFVIKNSILINNKEVSVEFIANMDTVDYTTIAEIITNQLDKIKL